MARFLRDPVSIRGAVSAIVTGTAVIVVVSGVLMRVLDHREYANVWRGMWWALQTVTTVGYGDVTPQDKTGRLVAAFVMFEGIALIAIVTAAITSTFVQRAQRAHQTEEALDETQEKERAEARYDDIVARLERLEAMLRSLMPA